MNGLRFKVCHPVALAIGLAVLSGLPAHAQDPANQLKRAVDLFENGQFVPAQEALIGIERSKLNSTEQSQRDDYLTRVQVAITMSEKAVRDWEDAQTALDEGDQSQAKLLLEKVLANDFATAPLRRLASARLGELGGGQAQAALTSGAVAAQAPQSPPAPSGLSRTQRAGALTDQADDLTRAARYEEARRLYEEALQVVPGFPEAVDGLQRVKDHVRNLEPSRQETLLDRLKRENRINWQRTVAEYRDVERLIRDHMDKERFDQANQLVARAKQVVEAGKQFADPITGYETLRAEAQGLAELVLNAERFYNQRKVEDTRMELQRQREEHLRDVDKRRREQVEALMDQARQHRKDGDLRAAINVLKQIIIIDPKNRVARWTMDDWEDIFQYKRGRKARENYYEQSRRALNSVEETKIPWDDELLYPDNWPELIARPERKIIGVSRASDRIFGQLDRRIPVEFDAIPFDTVMEQLSKTNNLNIIVNWADLQRAGIDRQATVELDLPNEITLKRALTEILSQAGAGEVELGFDVVEGSVKVATRSTLDRITFTAVYDINDLLMEVRSLTGAPINDLAEITRRAGIRGARNADMPWNYGDDDDDEPEVDTGRQRRVQRIVELIQETVAPDSWYDRGGSIGSIKEINGQLVITQNSANQNAISGLFDKLRQQTAVQIAVEAVFITITSNYLEELGIDLDIVLNAGNAGFDFTPSGSGPLIDPVLGTNVLLPRSFTRLGFLPNTPALGTGLVQSAAPPQPFSFAGTVPQQAGGGGSRLTPIPISNTVSSFTAATNLGSDIPGSFAGTTSSAFNFFGSFLDNIQVDFLVRATQADSRASVVTAPRLALANGGSSFVAVTVQQNFVSTLAPVVTTNAVAVAPTIGTVNSGATLIVTATVSADKRYVKMDLLPSVQRLLGIQTFPFSAGIGAANAFVQLPQTSLQSVNTTVSVPDGGTLLIGGQKLATETEVEAGVPILSKIPVLKRLYSSRTLVKDEQTLLILIKPKIMIQSEQEEIAFPAFGG